MGMFDFFKKRDYVVPEKVEEKKADYLFIAKDNQPTLRQDIAALELQALPPSAPHHR